MIENLFTTLVLFFPSLAWVILQPLGPGELLVTEVYYNAPGIDSEQEWIELANLGNQTIDISDYKIGDEESIWGGEGMFRFPEGSIIAPGQVVVVAQIAVGFRAMYGRDPDFEIVDSIPQVPDMVRYSLWSSGEVALANDGDEVLILDGKNQIIDSINYGDKLTYFSPSIGDVYSGQSIERIPASCDSETAADWQPQRFPTPGKVQLDGECSAHVEQDPANINLLSIGEIQGEDAISPYINELVEFRGIVTGAYEDQNADGIVFYTLFVQDIPGEEDSDPKTSDGIAIFLGLNQPQNQPGDIIQVNGKVSEFFGLTEIDDDELEITVIARDSSLPVPAPLYPPDELTTKQAYFEAYEGMLVTLPFAAQVVGPTHTGCGFAVLDSTLIDNPTPLRQMQESPAPVLGILHYSDVDCQSIPQLKTGDKVAGLVGPLIYHFDHFKIVQQDMSSLDVTIGSWSDSPVVQRLGENQFSIATINLENHFDNKRDSANSAEPVFSDLSLGIKRQKLVHTITKSLACPTIIAVQEVENETLLLDLVEETAVRCGFNYHISHRDGPDSRGLDVALLSDPRRTQITSTDVRQTCTNLDTGIEDPVITCPSGQSPLFGRPPLQVDVLVEDQPYVFIVNHFKSKRGDEAETQERRIQQSAFVRDLVGGILQEDAQAMVVVLGDMNDYERSNAMLKLTKNGALYNALENVTLEERYSYIFDGRRQLIDNILITEAMKPRVAMSTILHINSDYPIGLAENVTSDGLPFRGSDHDVPVIYLDLPIENVNSIIEIPQPTPTQKITPKNYPVSTPSIESHSDQSAIVPPLLWITIGFVILIIGSLILIIRHIYW